MTRRGETQEVELLEDGADDGEGAEPAVVTRRRRLPLTRIVAGVVIAVAGLAGVQWALDARERAAIAELARVPGVLAPVDEELVVERRVPAREAAMLFGYAGGVLDLADDGSQTYTWLPASGEGSGWSTQLLGPSAQLAGLESSSIVAGSGCQADTARDADPGSADRVVCLVTDGGFLIEPETGLLRMPTTSSEVLVLSATDGSVVARWPVEGGQAMALLPEDVVAIADVTADGTTLTGFDMLSGDERWTRTDPFLDGVTPDENDVSVSLFRTADLLAYAPNGGPLRLLSASGEVVRDLGDVLGVGAENTGWMSDEHGRISWTVWRDDGPSTTLVAPDGDPDADVTVEGHVVRASVDDGSVPGLLLAADDAVHAVDAGTGAERWSSDVLANSSSALVMRGKVFVSNGSRVVALDGDDGELLWSAEVEQGSTLSPSLQTDGRHLLLCLEDVVADGPARLLAYDPASGREAFRAAMPDGISAVGTAKRSLVGLDRAAGEYVLLG